MLAESEVSSRQAEREELDWLLNSRGLARSTNLARVLRFICEEHLAGRGSDIKEYTIALQALGRRPDFDPQTDTIVRVTVHSLRKRLEDIYEDEGAQRSIRVLIPSGRYVPLFVPHGQASQPLDLEDQATPPVEAATAAVNLAGDGASSLDQPLHQGASAGLRQRFYSLPAWKTLQTMSLLTIIVLCAASYFAYRHHRANAALILPRPSTPQGPFTEVHALMGDSRRPYTDHSGQVWSNASFCSGGSTVAAPARDIEGTEEPALFAGGVRGIVRCEFPVKPGLYELHFLFSEPSTLDVARRVAQISVNAGPYSSFDVVDEAGGTGRAVSTVTSKVSPENDGSIHVDYISEISPLNAIEILPITSGSLLPVRIVTGATSVVDADGNKWLSDRYYLGGRHGQTPKQASEKTNIYSSDRVGRFTYRIPVIPHGRYRIRLFFSEPWFGAKNGGKGGPGSRIFDVSCNGLPLLRNFDILAEGSGQPVVKTFDNIQANETGHLELAFLPEVNYPLINAIEVTPID